MTPQIHRQQDKSRCRKLLVGGGLGSCPRSVIIAAGDSHSDAVAAATLSDPSSLSTEPYLQRYASSDPLFLPIGGFANVETSRAPLLLTQSTRVGASGLSTATRFALQDLRSGGCDTARQAIIVGGPVSVPAAVETELVSLGFSEVFRVSGGNRYGTAAAIARSMDSASSLPVSELCGDINHLDHVTRQTFHGNAIVEWRPSRTQCELLPRTVVIADGLVAADALAATWWTSFWQVPILLHDGSNRLPAETSSFLATNAVDNVFILGGLSRISSKVESEIETLSNATIRRVDGPNRYATSVAMAQQFGGWWPTGQGIDFAGSLLCIVGSSAYGGSSVGWPDALVAGPFCAASSAAAAQPSAPVRAFSPVNGVSPGVLTPPLNRGQSAVPIILVAPQRDELPPSVETFLSEVFAPADRWCSSLWSVSCVEPGFALIFGGSSVIRDRTVGVISSAMSGRSGSIKLPVPSQLSNVFISNLSMGFVSYESGVGDTRVCFERGSYQETRWLSVRAANRPTPIAQVDAMLGGWYRRDADGHERSPGIGAPACLLFDATQDSDVVVTATGISGQTTEFFASTAPLNRLTMTNALVSSSPAFAGGLPLYSSDGIAGLTTLTFIDTQPQSNLLLKGLGVPIDAASITIDLYRKQAGDGAVTHRFEAAWLFSTVNGPVEGSASGEARYAADTWWIVGKAIINGSGAVESAGTGGFSGALIPNGPESFDDIISWRLDAFFGS